MAEYCYIADPSVTKNGYYFLTRVEGNGKRCNQMKYPGFSSYKKATKEAEKRNQKMKLTDEQVDEIVMKSIDESGDVIDRIES